MQVQEKEAEGTVTTPSSGPTSDSGKTTKSAVADIKVEEAQEEPVVPGKSHKCGACTKTFTTKALLNAHTSQRHARVCEICGHRFSRKSSLKTHLKVQHGTRSQIACSQQGCRRTFSNEKAFSEHMNTHTKQQTHVCCHCGRAYFSKHSLRSHERGCSGTSSFKCPMCDRVYHHKVMLRDHIQAVHEEQSFMCECGDTYRWRTSLKRHKKQCTIALSATESMVDVGSLSRVPTESAEQIIYQPELIEIAEIQI